MRTSVCAYADRREPDRGRSAGGELLYTGITTCPTLLDGQLPGPRFDRNQSDGNNLAGVNLAGQNLTNANFGYAMPTGANLHRGEMRGEAAELGRALSGYHGGQLYSTASYQAHDLTGIDLDGNNLTGVNLAGQNLTNASFTEAKLTNANLSGTLLNGAQVARANFNGAGLTPARFIRLPATRTEISRESVWPIRT